MDMLSTHESQSLFDKYNNQTCIVSTTDGNTHTGKLKVQVKPFLMWVDVKGKGDCYFESYEQVESIIPSESTDAVFEVRFQLRSRW